MGWNIGQWKQQPEAQEPDKPYSGSSVSLEPRLQGSGRRQESEGAWEGWKGPRAWSGFRKGLDWAGVCEECPSVSHSGVLLEPTAGWVPRAAG